MSAVRFRPWAPFFPVFSNLRDLNVREIRHIQRNVAFDATNAPKPDPAERSLKIFISNAQLRSAGWAVADKFIEGRKHYAGISIDQLHRFYASRLDSRMNLGNLQSFKAPS